MNKFAQSILSNVRLLSQNQSGIIHLLPILIAAVGIIAFLVFSSTAPINDGFWEKLFPKNTPNAAEVIPPNCPDKLQDRINATAVGGTLNLSNDCVYREFVTVNKRMTINGGHLRGSDVWDSSVWGQSGSTWVSNRTLPPMDPGDPHEWGCGNPRSFRCMAPEQVFLDGTALIQVPSNPQAGQFSVDGSRRVIIANNPSGHVLEVGIRPRWMRVSATGTVLQNMTIKHAVNGYADYAISANDAGGGVTLRNSKVSDAHMHMIDGSGLSVEYNEIFRSGCLGVGRVGPLIGNDIHHNNTEGCDGGWEAGGVKAGQASNVSWSNNHVHDNIGPGMWCDVSCNNITMANNIVHHNTMFGLFYELSSGGKIHDNYVWQNGYAYTFYGGGGGIVVSTSTNTEVYNNVIAWNATGIMALNETRGDWGYGNNNYHDNTFIMGIDAYATGVHGHGPANGDRGSNNRYWYPTGENGRARFAWGTDISTLSAFNATAGEENGRYLTTAEKDQILNAANMPTCQTCADPGQVPVPTIAPTTPPAPTPVPIKSPYGGTAVSLPGKIEAENYDYGGEGVSYHDVDEGNLGGVYRTDGVDVKTTLDTGAGHAVGWVSSGEWMEYTVNASSAGTYNFDFRVGAVGTDRTMELSVDGTTRGSVNVPSLTEWDQYGNATLSNINLTAGKHVIRVTMGATSYADFNYINVTRTSATTAPTTAPTSNPNPQAQAPYGGTARAIPGTIQTEDYDTGGEGVAYHDTSITNEGGAYRVNEGVDVKVSADTGGGHTVGFIGAGEWMEYTVNVSTTGNYDLQARVGSALAGRTFTVSFGGVNKATITVPQQSNWDIYQTVTIPNVALTTGNNQVMRITMGTTDYADINWVSFSRVTTAPTSVPTIAPTAAPTQAPVANGLLGEYFDTQSFTTPVLTRTDLTLNFNWWWGSPAANVDGNTFSVRWTGSVQAPTTGTYTLYANSDDGVRIWVNNQLILNRWRDQSAKESTGTVNLTAGQKTPIKVEYYENKGGAMMELRWTGPNIIKQIVPQSSLFIQ